MRGYYAPFFAVKLFWLWRDRPSLEVLLGEGIVSKSIGRLVPMRQLREPRCGTLDGAGPVTTSLLVKGAHISMVAALTRDGSRIC